MRDVDYYRKPESAYMDPGVNRLSARDLYDSWQYSGKPFSEHLDDLNKSNKMNYGDFATEYIDMFKKLRAENRGAVARRDYPQLKGRSGPQMMLEPRLVETRKQPKGIWNPRLKAKGGTVRKQRQKRKGGGKVFYGYKKGGQV